MASFGRLKDDNTDRNPLFEPLKPVYDIPAPKMTPQQQEEYDTGRHTFITNTPEGLEEAREGGFTPDSPTKRLMSIEPETFKELPASAKTVIAIQKFADNMVESGDLRPENKAKFVEHIVDAEKAKTKAGAAEVKAKRARKDKAWKYVVDKFGKWSYNKDGEYQGLTGIQRRSIERTIEENDLDMRLEEQPGTPEEGGFLGFGGTEATEPTLQLVEGRRQPEERSMPMPNMPQQATGQQPMSPEQPMQPAPPAEAQEDSFGFKMGEIRKGHMYIGNDQWQPVQ